MTKRILIAGFHHETNTFAPSPAAYENFLHGEGAPGLMRGNDVLALRDVNVGIGGFIRAAEAADWALTPVLWTHASPSAAVTEDAYERIAGEIVAAVKAGIAARREGAGASGGSPCGGPGEFDAIYLDLHGAMVAAHVDDGEGELLARIRAEAGATVPIVASLDLHANVTARMLDSADALVAYRTYPHVDMADTGRRAAALMAQLLIDRDADQPAWHRAARRLPFLIPINGMCTLVDPAKDLYASLTRLEDEGHSAVHRPAKVSATGAAPILSLSFTPGFPAADFDECGPVIWGMGHDAAMVDAAVDALFEKMMRDEGAWEVPFLTPEDAVAEALRLAGGRPVLIADTQDNPGAGGNADTMGMLRALLAHPDQAAVYDVAFGLIADGEAAAAAHAAGVGAVIDIALGGRSNIPGDAPVRGKFEVVQLSDGTCRYDGPMMHGIIGNVGPSAWLRIGGVNIAVSTSKAQTYERNLFRMVGIVPERMRVLVLKSSVHFRADFQPIAEAVLVAKAPGPMLADPADLPWKHLCPGIRMRPRGPEFQP